jgi:hypothetical protein
VETILRRREAHASSTLLLDASACRKAKPKPSSCSIFSTDSTADSHATFLLSFLYMSDSIVSVKHARRRAMRRQSPPKMFCRRCRPATGFSSIVRMKSRACSNCLRSAVSAFRSLTIWV